MRAIFIASLVGLLAGGCATTQVGRGDPVNEVALIAPPTTLNLDGQPGADGFAVRVYVIKAGNAKGAPISNGAVELLMFDGRVGSEQLLAAAPAQTWRFTPRELEKLEEQTALGTAYHFALRWAKQPARPAITVVARYVPPKGGPIYSPPSAIANAAAK